MDNWTTLFAAPADCACDDCSNIFSPSAYLVDIMQYLDNCPSNGAGSKSVLQVLFERRPDIGNLLLTCENTNTEIPYIDLVNEIMEYYVVYTTTGGRILSDVHAAPADPNLSAVLVAAGTPAVTASVTNGSNKLVLSVAASVITGLNFKVGDILLLAGVSYKIAIIPAIPGTAASISLSLDQVFGGTTNASLPANSIQVYGAAADTGNATARELKAEPQYTLLDAYKQVYQRVYPFNLPYHQPLDAIRSYLKFVKTSRAELLETFGQYYAKDSSTPPVLTLTGIPLPAIDAEWMGLSLAEYEILTGTDFTGAAAAPKPGVEDYFGNATPAYTGNGIPVSGFLKRTGIEYTDLLQILETRFVNPGQDAYNVLQRMLGQSVLTAQGLYTELSNNTWSGDAVFSTLLASLGITNASFTTWLTNNFATFKQVVTIYQSTNDCDIDHSFLYSIGCLYETPPSATATSPAPDVFITAAFLSRLHRFIRLWRKTGWEIHELDNMITALGETDITPDLVHKLAITGKTNTLLDLPLLQLAAFWGDIDSYGDNAVNTTGSSLYAQLFLKNTGRLISGGKTQLTAFMPNPLDQLLPPAADPALSFAGNLPAILAALNISADDFANIAANAGIDPLDAVSIKGLSAIYRYSLLAGALEDMAIADLCLLEKLFHPAFGELIPVGAANTGTGIATILLSANTPATVSAAVTNGSNTITLTVSAANIAGVNFKPGDILVLGGVKYVITGPLPAIPGTSPTVQLTIDRNYAGTTFANLPASQIQFFQLDPSATFDFIKIARKVLDSGFEVARLNYIFTGSFKGIDNIALSQDQILQAIQSMRSGLLKIDSDNPQTDFDSITPALFTQKIQLLCSKQVTDQFLLLLESTVLASLQVTTPDQGFSIATLPVASQPKYAYVTTLVFTPVSGLFQAGEAITDAAGSTATIIAVNGSTLTLSGITLAAGNSGLSGLITGGTSTAQGTITAFTRSFQLTGFMTDAERAAITGSAGFNAAVTNLYQQSLDALNAGFIHNVQVQDNSFAIPDTLSPKYFYTQSGISWFLQCRGIMTDDEFSQLNGQGNTAFQAAVKYIYTYPYIFLKNNFSGLYTTENDLDIATLYLFNASQMNTGFVVPAGYTPIRLLKGKMQYFYTYFLPFIVGQLKSKQVLSAVGSLVGLDLPVLQAVISSADMNMFIQDASETGLTASYYNNNFSDPAPVVQTDAAINKTWIAGQDVLPANIPAATSPFSVRWKGWISAPADGDYLFSLTPSVSADTVKLIIDGNTISNLALPVFMTGAKLVPVTIEYVHSTGNAGLQMFWQSATMPQALVDTSFLYTDNDIRALEAKLYLCHRGSQYIIGFHINATEAGYMVGNPADFAGINFLPPTSAQWQRTYGYTQLRKIMPANLLLPLFRMANAEDKLSPGALPSDALITAIAGANKPGWNKDYVSFLAGNKDTTPATPGYFNFSAADFKNEQALLTIKKAMDLAVKTKMPVSATGLPAWTFIENTLATDADFDSLAVVAAQIRDAVKGKYSSNWQTIAVQLNNSLRENQKDALIAYLLTLDLQSTDGSGTVADANALFEYLLIDVQMTATVVTSRLIQATLAVQLFADRCLLGLESAVQPDPVSHKFPIDTDEWDWMKHYSIAAGLKKLFAFVENYLDPSLRDDKSPFFTDFESSLKKGDITDQSAEDAFRDYLYKLNEVSNLEIVGTYYDTSSATLHAFARTHAAPYNYYYRTARNTGRDNNSWTWAAWEHVMLDIKSTDDGDNSGVQLMPVIWKNRLFLFWPEFSEKTTATPNSSSSKTFQELGNSPLNDPANIPQKYWEVRLGWSEYANGKWTAKKMSKELLTPLMTSLYVTTDVITMLALTKPRQYFLRSSIQNNALTIYLMIRYSGQLSWSDFVNFKNDAIPVGNFHLTDIHEKITVGGIPDWMAAEIDLDYSQNNGDIFQTSLFSSNFYEPFFQALAEKNKLTIDGIDFLKASNEHRILFSNDVTIPDFENSVSRPFFYTDTSASRSYFATPVAGSYVGRPKKPVKTHPVRTLKNKTDAPLYIYNPVHIPVVQVSGLVREAVTPTMLERVSFSIKNPLAGSIPAPPPPPPEPIAYNTLVLADTTRQTYPLVTNLDNSPTNQFSIGRIVAKGSKNPLGDRVMQFPAFSGFQVFLPLKISKLAFYTFYHPFASLLINKLNQGGVPALLGADTAEFPEDPNYPNISGAPVLVANDQGSLFVNSYIPNTNAVVPYNASDPLRNYYLQNMDFSLYGTYAGYNWELFFHAPFLVATSLSKNGRYAEARKWFHYIFNPLSKEVPDAANANSPYWGVLPFKKAMDQEFSDYVQGLQTGYDNDTQIDAWRQDPFNAFLIARARPIAFMKNTVMAYLDMLLGWGDHLFQSYTRENINAATQLYVMAAKILGPAPQYMAERGTMQSASYNALKTQLDDFGDALVQLENAFPNTGDTEQSDNTVPQNLLGIGRALYFCVPPNGTLLAYWTTVNDRLYKIRHGENIDGLVVPLALYEPPIDPALLLQAKAQGLSIDGILSDLESPAPLYRFTYLLQKAREFCGEVVTLGSAVLSANEKQDAEELARLRQTQEVALLGMVTEVKTRQVLEAQANLDSLVSSRATSIVRLSHFVEDLLGNPAAQVPEPAFLGENVDENTSLPGETIINKVSTSVDTSLVGAGEAGVKVIPKELQELVFSDASGAFSAGAASGELLAGILRLVPQFDVDGEPLGVGVGSGFGGVQLGTFAELAAKALHSLAAQNATLASHAGKMATFIRREQDWAFQANLAAREIVQLDKQIIAGQIRLQIAMHDLENHRQQIENATAVETFLETKFTNQELFQWMTDKLQAVHKQGYQLAYDMARKAEKAYRFELGIPNTNFVQYGYYQDACLGITSGEQLQLALREMDASWVENNAREFELVKHIPLAQLDPLALLQLRETGACQFYIPEEWIDMDYPGHYFRRIKSVSISIPCVAGPYTTVNSTLRLLKNSIRVSTATDKGYPRKTSGGMPQDDSRFAENNIPCTAIATSSAQNDSGMFDLNYRDERYLPFEGAGVISSWQLELNGKYVNNDDGTITDLSQFDYDTITDIIIHIRYTSREDDGEFRQAAITNLAAYTGPFMRLFSLRHEFPNAWYAFLNQPAVGGDQTLSLAIDSGRFTYLASRSNPVITSLALFAEASDDLPSLRVTSPGGIVNTNFSFDRDTASAGDLLVSIPAAQAWQNNTMGSWTITKPGNAELPAIADIWLVATYKLHR